MTIFEFAKDWSKKHQPALYMLLTVDGDQEGSKRLVKWLTENDPWAQTFKQALAAQGEADLRRKAN